MDWRLFCRIQLRSRNSEPRSQHLWRPILRTPWFLKRPKVLLNSVPLRLCCFQTQMILNTPSQVNNFVCMHIFQGLTLLSILFHSRVLSPPFQRALRLKRPQKWTICPCLPVLALHALHSIVSLLQLVHQYPAQLSLQQQLHLYSLLILFLSKPFTTLVSFYSECHGISGLRKSDNVCMINLPTKRKYLFLIHMTLFLSLLLLVLPLLLPRRMFKW